MKTQNLPNEATAISEDLILPNEATAISEDLILPNEATAISEDPILPNEPAWRRGGTQPDENGVRALACLLIVDLIFRVSHRG